MELGPSLRAPTLPPLARLTFEPLRGGLCAGEMAFGGHCCVRFSFACCFRNASSCDLSPREEATTGLAGARQDPTPTDSPPLSVCLGHKRVNRWVFLQDMAIYGGSSVWGMSPVYPQTAPTPRGW